MTASSSVLINGRRALRVDDVGRHDKCCGKDAAWRASAGSNTVLINHRLAHRSMDGSIHSDSRGVTIDGSANVVIGDYWQPSRHAEGPYNIEVQVVIGPDRIPMAFIPYELLDSKEAVILQGKTDAQGWIVIADVPLGSYSIRLRDGWILFPHVQREQRK